MIVVEDGMNWRLAVLAVTAGLFLIAAVLFRRRRHRLERPTLSRTALVLLAVYCAGFAGLLGLTSPNDETAFGFWLYSGILVTASLAAAAGTIWPRATSRGLWSLAIAVPAAWIVFVSTYAEITGDDAGDAGLLVLPLGIFVSAPFVVVATLFKRSTEAPSSPAGSAGWYPDANAPGGFRYWDGTGWTTAGWYPDETMPGGFRYWDGTRWTEDRLSVTPRTPSSQRPAGPEP